MISSLLSLLVYNLKSFLANSAACSVAAIYRKHIEELFTTVTLTCSLWNNLSINMFVPKTTG